MPHRWCADIGLISGSRVPQLRAWVASGGIAPVTQSGEIYRIDQQVTDNRKQKRDQRTGDDDAGVHHPLEDLIDHILLGDMTGQCVANQLNVGLDRGEFPFLVEHMVLRPLLRIALTSETSCCSALMVAVCSSGVMFRPLPLAAHGRHI